MKEHEIRELVNRCRDIAVAYAHSQQLREVLGSVIKDALAKQWEDGYDAGVDVCCPTYVVNSGELNGNP